METVSTTQDALDAIVQDALPPQGCWSEADYLWLTDHTRRLARQRALARLKTGYDLGWCRPSSRAELHDRESPR